MKWLINSMALKRYLEYLITFPQKNQYWILRKASCKQLVIRSFTLSINISKKDILQHCKMLYPNLLNSKMKIWFNLKMPKKDSSRRPSSIRSIRSNGWLSALTSCSQSLYLLRMTLCISFTQFNSMMPNFTRALPSQPHWLSSLNYILSMNNPHHQPWFRCSTLIVKSTVTPRLRKSNPGRSTPATCVIKS